MQKKHTLRNFIAQDYNFVAIVQVKKLPSIQLLAIARKSNLFNLIGILAL
jgi:hypothetical protein